MRVLLVEDSDSLRRSIATGLRRSGYAVDLAATGPEGLWQAGSIDYDVIILDIMLPGLDGLSVLKQLRTKGNSTHVLLLTAKDTVADRVTGLRTGADDYLVKPFAFDELLARIEALTRRQHLQKDPIIRIGDLQLNTMARTLHRADQDIPLLPREYALLEFLVMHRGQVVTRSDIEQHIYDREADFQSNVVDSAICALRRKIDLPGNPSLIETRRRMGYILLSFDSPDQKAPLTPSDKG